MWSVGVILYVVLCGSMPFYVSDDGPVDKLYSLIKKGKYETSFEWNRLSDFAKDCISKLLQIDPEKRLTAKMALKHPWILSVHRGKSITLIRGYIRNGTHIAYFPADVICHYYDVSIFSKPNHVRFAK